MRHKNKCKRCGYKFYLTKDNLYIVRQRFEAFDCPKCGCQNIVGIREERMKVDNENASEED